MNKYNFFSAIAALGIVIYAFGVWAKITHQSYSNEVIGTGLIFGSIGLSAFVWLLFMWLKKDQIKKNTIFLE
jgi:hypothetical protein